MKGIDYSYYYEEWSQQVLEIPTYLTKKKYLSSAADSLRLGDLAACPAALRVRRGEFFFLFTQRKVTLLLPACRRQDTFLISNAQRRSKKEDWGKLGPNIIHYLTWKAKN